MNCQIAMQDRLDGGISIIMRCAGSEAPATLSPEHFTVDLYVTPCEHRETPECIGGDLMVLVQAFSEEFVVPHLQRFTEHCRIEGIIPPRHCKSILSGFMFAGSFFCKQKTQQVR
jgi:hypothetical protein